MLLLEVELDSLLALDELLSDDALESLDCGSLWLDELLDELALLSELRLDSLEALDSELADDSLESELDDELLDSWTCR